MDFKDMSDELKAKARACRTPEEIMELASAEGYELTAEEINSVSGGSSWTKSDWKCNTLDCENDYCDALDCDTYYSGGGCFVECGTYTSA